MLNSTFNTVEEYMLESHRVVRRSENWFLEIAFHSRNVAARFSQAAVEFFLKQGRQAVWAEPRETQVDGTSTYYLPRVTVNLEERGCISGTIILDDRSQHFFGMHFQGEAVPLGIKKAYYFHTELNSRYQIFADGTSQRQRQYEAEPQDLFRQVFFVDDEVANFVKDALHRKAVLSERSIPVRNEPTLGLRPLEVGVVAFGDQTLPVLEVVDGHIQFPQGIDYLVHVGRRIISINRPSFSWN